MTRRWIAFLPVCFALGCDTESDDVRIHYPPPRLAVVSHLDAKPERYELVDGSGLGFSFSTRSLSGAGRFSGLRGWLKVDPKALRRTRGTVRVDLLSLELEPSPWLTKAIAFRALGLSSEEPGSETMRRATFRIRDVLAVDPENLWQATPREQGDGTHHIETEWHVRGELELHGFRAEQELRLRLSFVVQPDGDGANPLSIRVTETKPLDADLSAHRVLLPSDPDAPWKQRSLGRIQLNGDLTFRPTP